MEEFTNNQNFELFAQWRNEYHACRSRDDYRRYYISYINCEDNPFKDRAIEKVELFNLYKNELDQCNSVKDLENYVLKYLDSDNPYLREAKTKIAEASKLSTPRWGLYRIIGGICCFVLAFLLFFFVKELSGTANGILGLIGFLSVCGIILFTICGIWLILKGAKNLKNF